MALKWAWGFSTDQTTVKLEAVGWRLLSSDPADTSYIHTYPGDAVSKRSALRIPATSGHYLTPNGVAALDGWACISSYTTTYFYGHPTGSYPWLRIEQAGLTGIYISPVDLAAATRVALYVDNTYKATSTLYISPNSWNYFAVKYEGSTTTFAATVYVNGVECISQQTDTATTAWSDLSQMRLVFYGNGYGQNTWRGGFVTYDSTSDAGEVEVWCSTYEPQTDDAETGTWTPSTGATNFGVITPWDTATYTEEVSPTTGDKFTCGYTDSIATRLGITPTIHAVVSQQAVSGGSDFKALLDVGSGDVVGATVTSDTNDPTYGYSTETSGITASSTVKIGIKIP